MPPGRHHKMRRKRTIEQEKSGALLIGRFLMAFFFFVDGLYKFSAQAWPSFRQVIFDSFKELGIYNNYSYGGLADVIAVAFCLFEVVGSILLALGWREAGSILLCFYLVVENGIQNGSFLLMRGVDMLKFIPFLRNLALAGGLIVVGAYTQFTESHSNSNNSDNDFFVPNTRQRQLKSRKSKPEFDPDATPLKEM